MKVVVKDSVLQAFMTASKVGTPFNEKQSAQSEVTYLTEHDLKPSSSTGRNNIIRFVNGMLRDFETIHHKLKDKDGKVEIVTPGLDKVKIPWAELMVRLSPYFVTRYSKANLTPEQKGVPMGKLVLEELKAAAPRFGDSPQRFLRWLGRVDNLAPPAVAI